MRKFIYGIAFGVCLAVTANLATAQTGDSTPPPPPGHWGHGQMDPATQAAHMAKRLSLTPAQQTQVQSILTNRQAQMKALDENQAITHQQWLTQTKALHEQTKTQIDALLTDTQKQAMSQHMRPGPMGDREGPPPPPEQ